MYQRSQVQEMRLFTNQIGDINLVLLDQLLQEQKSFAAAAVRKRQHWAHCECLWLRVDCLPVLVTFPGLVLARLSFPKDAVWLVLCSVWPLVPDGFCLTACLFPLLAQVNVLCIEAALQEPCQDVTLLWISFSLFLHIDQSYLKDVSKHFQFKTCLWPILHICCTVHTHTHTHENNSQHILHTDWLSRRD